MDIKKEIIIRSVKILDIGFITVIYFLIAFFSSVYIDDKLGKFDPKKADKKNIGLLFGEVCLHIYLIGVFTYVIRNLIELIPYPLNGIDGYDHKKLKELGGGVVFTFVFFIFQTNLREKLLYLYQRIKQK